MLAKFFRRGVLARLVTLVVVGGLARAVNVSGVRRSGVISFAADEKDPRWLYRIIHGAFKRSAAFHAPETAQEDLR